MQRINKFHSLFTILIFGVVASLIIDGYGSLVIAASLSNALQREYAWYDSYRSLDDATVAQEIAANINWAADPIAAQWRDAVAKQTATNSAIDALIRRSRDPRETAALDAIARDHAKAIAGAWRVMLMVAQRDRNAQEMYRTQVLARYQTLTRRIEVSVVRHLDIADALGGRLDVMGWRLRWLMIGIGVLGLLIVTGLTYTMRVYRKNADEATRREFRRLKQVALSDSLTALGNHRAFREDLARELSRSRRHGHALTLALVDLDDFKALNDARGHAHGDAILVETAAALASGRLEDRAYRIGGDEFAMLLIETPGSHARVVLERFRENLRKRLLGATVSIGFCELQDDFDGHDIYERADAALYAAKRSGRDGIVDFSEICDRTPMFSARKTVALQTLIEQRALSIAFQPIWNVSRKDILGFEALARPDPRLDLSGPQEAFDIAEHQRRVADLDRVCVDKILETIAGLPGSDLVFVNVTPETLGRQDFYAGKLAAAVQAAGLETRQIAIEVTERRITDTRELVRHVSELSDLGFLTALDDTGSGWAGLEILSKFTFDFVKIDRSVIADAMTHKRARGVLAGIIAIAAEGGSFLIGEGIETREQLDFLRDLRGASAQFTGIAGVQGYLLGRPRSGRPDPAAFARYRHILSGPRAAEEPVAS